MAQVSIEEFVNVAETVRGAAPIPLDPPIATQVVAITGASLQSAPFNALTRFIRINTDAVCSIRNNEANPAATTASGRWSANTTEFRGVSGGNKLAVISNT